MAITVSSNQNKNRGRPEEIVRQKLLSFLVEELGYPKSLISTEVSIGSLTQSSSRRRVDILCSFVNGDRLSPFLLIECKARKPAQKAIYQLIGYNTAIGAQYLAIVWESGIYCIRINSDGFQVCDSLPPFSKKTL